jgi:transaldolase
MQIYVDSANISEIREALSVGLCDGVTTNPSLIARENKSMESAIHEICELVKGPVHAETLSLEAEGIVKEGRLYAGWGKNIVVKVPFCREGLKAVKVLSEENIACNVTLIFSHAQALLAAKAGARYLCPFVGRLDDIGGDGIGLVSDIVELLDGYVDFDCEVIVASIRHVQHVMDSAACGAHIATVPAKVLLQMEKHPLTDSGIEAFLKDAEKSARFA